MLMVAAVPITELARLFTGDEHSAPCPSATLIERICELTEPASVTSLKDRLYGPDWPTDEIAVDEREAMAVGYANWANHRKET